MGTPGKKGRWETDSGLRSVLEDLVRSMMEGTIRDKDRLQDEKIKALRSADLDHVPANSVLLDYVRKEHPGMESALIELLKKKPSRTLSGVAVVAVMTSPSPCPHGKCIFCPGGVEQEVPTPQSYTGREPAAMRASQNGYDPFLQTTKRIEQLEEIGHPTDKIDLILMGGTITARPVDYQVDFVKGCLDGLNGCSSETFEQAGEMNETSRHRCIGMTFETRPDHLHREELDLMLSLGGTRIELGVQSVFERPLKISGRGHGVKESIDATRISRDSGLKVGYHLMPGIPGSNIDMDIQSAALVYQDERFKPDMIKLYPTLVIEGTRFYEMWKAGEYEPLETEDAAKLVAEIKRITPPWVRIQRVQRDIPSPLVEAGVKKSNLRQLAQAEMHRRGWECRCIRCREIGRRMKVDEAMPLPEDISLARREYDASGGKEVFLSFEVGSKDAIVGFLRLRRPSEKAYRKEVDGAGMVRELKVFGPMVPIGKGALSEWQHRGYGHRLLEHAISITRDEWGYEKVLVTSGIGAREYYRRSGFERIGPYMGKYL
ncbi:MAG: tRNA uridine(34) 5-carboxymethylaminomethyl modification radical SAM/GNAT enzyme Elp3 [Candidatus Thermoplasmatota archaeon]|nr:tRNA uridine(34) 5-carboxymethylaminomethyl modification radical SAM/GNAT enzyme Elp3 [Candidatus Thermoplasmatota archaeon]